MTVKNYLQLTIMLLIVGQTIGEGDNTAFGKRFVFSTYGKPIVVVTAASAAANVQLTVNGVLNETYLVNVGVPTMINLSPSNQDIFSIESDQDVLVQLIAVAYSYYSVLTLVLPDNVLDNVYPIIGTINYWNVGNPSQLLISSTENDNISCTLSSASDATTYSFNPARRVVYYKPDQGGAYLVCDKKVFVADVSNPTIPYTCAAVDYNQELSLPRRYYSRAFALSSMTDSCKPETPSVCCQIIPQFDCRTCQQFFRVIALNNDTHVNVSAPTEQLFTLQANEIKDFFIPESDTAWLTSDKPVSVMQYQTGAEYIGTDTIGPISVTVQPEGSYLSQYTFTSCFDATMRAFLRVVIETTEKNQLLLNGNAFLTSNAGKAVYGTKYSSFIHELLCGRNAIQFTVQHPQNKTFGLITFGWRTYDSFGSIVGLGQPGLDKFLTLTVANETVVINQCKAAESIDVSPPEEQCESECCNVPSERTFEDTVINTGCQKTINRTWSVTDGCNRTTTASQTIIVNQQLDVYKAPPENVELSNCAGIEDINFTSEPELVCESFCGTTVNVTKSDQVVAAGQVIRTWTVQHICGNLTTFVQNITCSNATTAAPPGSSCQHPVIEDIPFKKVKVCRSDDHPKVSKPKVVWDHECCKGQLNWTSTQRTLRKDDCEKYVSILWTVTDGCGVSVSKEEYILIEKQLDEYKHPKDVHLDECSQLEEKLDNGKPHIRKNCGTTEKVHHFDEKFDDAIIRTWKISNKCGKPSSVFVQRYSCSETEEPSRTDSPSVPNEKPEKDKESEESKHSDESDKEKSCEHSEEGCLNESPECHGDCEFIYLE